MKKLILFILFIIAVVFVIAVIFYRIHPGDEFCVKQSDINALLKRGVENNDSEVFDKIYLHYNYCEHDYQKGVDVLKVGAQMGLPEVQYRLGNLLMYYKQNKEGMHWLKESAKQGNAKAIEKMLLLDVAYEN